MPTNPTPPPGYYENFEAVDLGEPISIYPTNDIKFGSNSTRPPPSKRQRILNILRGRNVRFVIYIFAIIAIGICVGLVYLYTGGKKAKEDRTDQIVAPHIFIRGSPGRQRLGEMKPGNG